MPIEEQALEAYQGGYQTAIELRSAARLREAYPPLPDGRTLFPFRRVFAVAETKV